MWNASPSTIVPSATAMIGFTYVYSDTIATSRCCSA
jgi:hypothetical protein